MQHVYIFYIYMYIYIIYISIYTTSDMTMLHAHYTYKQRYLQPMASNTHIEHFDHISFKHKAHQRSH